MLVMSLVSYATGSKGCQFELSFNSKKTSQKAIFFNQFISHTTLFKYFLLYLVYACKLLEHIWNVAETYLCNGLLMPISRWISVSLSALIIAPDLTLARQAATYHAGMPTHSSSQATIVGPFHSAKGVPAFIASARSSCL